MAARTGERVTEPAWQADPVDAATPGSIARTSAPTLPTKLTLSVFGNRAVGWPLSVTFSPKIPLSPSQNRSRNTRTCGIPTHFRRRVARRAQGDGQEDVLRPRPPARLVSRAVDERLDLRPFPYVERPDPLRGVHLVAGHREEVHAQFLDVGRDLSHGLRRVRVERDACLTSDGGDLGDRLDRSHLVVGVHDRDEDGPGCDRLPHIVRIHHPVPIHRQDRHPRAKFLQEPARVERRRMFHCSRDDMVPRVPVCEVDPLDGMVVRLAPAAGKDHFGRIAPKGPPPVRGLSPPHLSPAFPAQWRLDGFP